MTACSDTSTFVHLCQPRKTDARNLQLSINHLDDFLCLCRVFLGLAPLSSCVLRAPQDRFGKTDALDLHTSGLLFSAHLLRIPFFISALRCLIQETDAMNLYIVA